ncbi:uncharacterized protein GGS22DRAFT_153947 [Annulohypoxylon maeteangense]|uniref:uncharacterized protein n=1 Tax=Annulohypoxylon maeteangense TaxID=1927788 RepID=UPI002007967A|nr:uncharacterized protein GGS22DRAFT_153947 [Annulohypoxylon maeteangense]KAI0889460.1 hypothetical protein GGS22DRAFT_153947 [Annulohypoxylon maeteangense]
MPIGDLLAEISGDNPSSAPTPKTPASSNLKRKAEDDSQSATSVKLVKSRQQDGSYSANKVVREVKNEPIDRTKTTTSTSSKPSSLPHRTNSPATNGRYEPPVPTGPRVIGSSSNGRPTPGSNTTQPRSSTSTAIRPKLSSASLAAAAKAPLARSSPTTPTSSDPSKPPKKGSYAEIMERAKKAQAKIVPGKVGVIQHRAIEKNRPVKPEPKSGMAKNANGKTYSGSARPSSANRGVPRAGMASSDGRNGASKNVGGNTSTKARHGSLGGEAEKKLKKAATATTGYTGTARPRPGATSGKSSSSKKGPSYKAGGLLAPPRSNRRDKYEDEYDDDLDDFIEYDDDEDPDPRHYDYASDGSSDMEAGLSDIDVEERRAEVLAREEDKREQALEEKLRREKEERRRRLNGGR